MHTPENPDAGQGPVPLDIGDDVGALVVTMPDDRPDLADLEVEIRPVGATRRHGHTHHHTDHDHDHAYPHVGVVGRPTPAGTVHSLVYAAVAAGDYELCPMPGDDVVLTATVVGGEVTELDWPG
ncbi:hypothetical protein [Phycicoccus sonneratiae]|uniref:Uncharacterized protein n=1 Tax=Phycicoccus sonneratiae TaxID=2807628 RepID=A0ABS2CJ14_9MICO|nr:hypothetical protein [Phycicoccus sonneraticus]MBM6399463.1 hypothetical protein [Phycicoccus sonneraticus]